MLLCLTLVNVIAISPTAAQEIPRITKEELKQKLGDKQIIILDVRIGKDWDAGEFKIQGAIRENPDDFESRAAEYPKNKTLILYCS